VPHRTVGCAMSLVRISPGYGIDLTDQMVAWNDLVEIKRIQGLDLTILQPTHHASPPLISASN
jgi:hypothetical protein